MDTLPKYRVYMFVHKTHSLPENAIVNIDFVSKVYAPCFRSYASRQIILIIIPMNPYLLWATVLPTSFLNQGSLIFGD